MDRINPTFDLMLRKFTKGQDDSVASIP